MYTSQPGQTASYTQLTMGQAGPTTRPVRRTSFKEDYQHFTKRVSDNFDKAKRRLSNPPDELGSKKSRRDSGIYRARFHTGPTSPYCDGKPAQGVSSKSVSMPFTGMPETRPPVGYGPPRQESLYYESERLNRQSMHLDADEDLSFYEPYLASMPLSMEHEQHNEIMEQEQHQQHSQQEPQYVPVDFMANSSMHRVQKGRPRLSVITNRQEDSGDESDHDEDDGSSIASATPGGQRYHCPWPQCPKPAENEGFHMNRLKEHIRRAHIKPYVCAFDGCNFRRGDHNQIKRHYRTKHFHSGNLDNESVVVDTDDELDLWKHQSLKIRSLDYTQVTNICCASAVPSAEQSGSATPQTAVPPTPISPPVVIHHADTAGSPRGEPTPTVQQQPRRFSYDTIMNAIGFAFQMTSLDEAHKARFLHALHSQLVTVENRTSSLQVAWSDTTARPPSGPVSLSNGSSANEPASCSSSINNIPAPMLALSPIVESPASATVKPPAHFDMAPSSYHNALYPDPQGQMVDEPMDMDTMNTFTHNMDYDMQQFQPYIHVHVPGPLMP